MITLGTAKLTLKEEKEIGLVGEHDYAVLDMKEVGPQRLLLIKNPWCDGMVWKGARIIPDEGSLEESWTTDLKEALPSKSTTCPGTFWMTFEDVTQNFESLYLNWNPGFFLYRQDHHFSWSIPPISTRGSFTHNPQYAAKSSTKGTLWVLLSRHFVTSDIDIVKNKPTAFKTTSNSLGFISLYVFEAGGRRVYLSDDALHRGAFVDSPQTLARLDISPSVPLTIVVAQHGLPLPKYSFSLSFFSRAPLTINSAADSFPHYTSHTGSWTSRTAGGNASAPSYPLNPQFSITIPSSTDLTLILETDDEELAVHVKIVWGGGDRVTAVTSRDILGGSGDYRRGCALASLRNVAAGKYTLVCSTFEAGQLGNFTLRVGSTVPCSIRPVPAEGAGRLSLRLPVLVFQDGVDRMLAPLTMVRLTKMRVVARSGISQGTRSRPLLKLSIEKGQGPNKEVLNVSGNGEFSDAPMGVRTADVDLSPLMSNQGGLWIVVERLGGRTGVDDVDVEVLSEGPVKVGLWGFGEG
jgi:calpain-7